MTGVGMHGVKGGDDWDVVVTVSACGYGAVSSFQLLDIQVRSIALLCEQEISSKVRISRARS